MSEIGDAPAWSIPVEVLVVSPGTFFARYKDGSIWGVMVDNDNLYCQPETQEHWDKVRNA